MKFQELEAIVPAGSSVMYYLRNFMRKASEFNRRLLVSLVRPQLANSIQLSAVTVSWKHFRRYLVAILLRQSLGVAPLHGHETGVKIIQVPTATWQLISCISGSFASSMHPFC